MTFEQVLAWGKKVLRKHCLQDAELDAWYLMEHVWGMSRSEYFLCMKEETDKDREITYKELIKKRSSHIPLQHLTGWQEFMGLPFRVNEHVLIPRQDTEILVEEVLKYAKPGMRVLDLCTGSGCILVSILKYTQDIEGTGVDISPQALTVAKENAQQNNVKAKFVQSDLFDNVQGEFDIIVSNPPYIATSEIEKLMEEVREHEPMLALDGEEDGLYFYRKIVQQSMKFLKPGGRLIMEIGYDQRKVVCELLENNLFTNIYSKQDLAGLDRITAGCAPAGET